MAEHVLLIGMMGSGKTTIGKLLAQRLQRRYIDSDEEVEASTGRTVRQIFEADGEAAFRLEEARVLREALGADAPAVIAVAGGAVLSNENRRLVRHGGTVVWLRARVETLAGRVRSDDHRPLLGDDPAAALARLYEARKPLYEDLAEVTVDVDEMEPDAVASAILERL